jgi:hypothetical protein
MRIRAGLIAGVLCVLGVLPSSRAAAQSWVVIPVVVGDSDAAELAASHARDPISAELAKSVPVLSPKTGRDRFEARGSSAPVAATHGDLDQLARDAQQALYHVAMGLYTSASADVARVLKRADHALESLNRETLSARQLLDSCLFIVRARLQERKPKAAREQALECRRLVPDIDPDASIHPPDVIGEVAAAEAQLESQRPASLRVTSEPSGCPVFIQGRNLGSTPLELPRLTPGAYRIQVECVPGEYGRVHRVTLGEQRTLVHVDSHFDAATQTGDGISLRYSTRATSERFALRHGIEVARLVGARYVAVIAPEGDGKIRISSLEVAHGKPLAQVIVGSDETGAFVDVSEAIAALRAGRSQDFSGVVPVAIASTPAVTPAAVSSVTQQRPASTHAHAGDASIRRDSDDDGQGPGAAGWTLAAVGAAAHLTGWALYAHQLSLESDYRKVRGLSDTSEARRRLARIDGFELLPPLTSAGGALLLTASLPWLLPRADSQPVPGWSIGVGVAGLAFAGTGVALLVRGAGCDEFDPLARCDDVVTTTHLGAQLLSSAVPLLALPAVYVLRSLGASEETPLTIDASPTGATLYWRGTL